MGKRGPVGSPGVTGRQGARGRKGPKGQTGARGRKTGEAKGGAINGVYKQIDKIYFALDVQMRRMAEIQAELNEVRAKVQRIAAGS